MTDTEAITNRVYDRHADMPETAARLGRLAAQHELEAAQPDTPPWLKFRLQTVAQEYRDAQAAELQLSNHAAAKQTELEDQAQYLDHYPYANILIPTRAFRWTCYALLAAALILLAALVTL